MTIVVEQVVRQGDDHQDCNASCAEPRLDGVELSVRNAIPQQGAEDGSCDEVHNSEQYDLPHLDEVPGEEVHDQHEHGKRDADTHDDECIGAPRVHAVSEVELRSFDGLRDRDVLVVPRQDPDHAGHGRQSRDHSEERPCTPVVTQSIEHDDDPFPGSLWFNCELFTALYSARKAGLFLKTPKGRNSDQKLLIQLLVAIPYTYRETPHKTI